MQVKNGINEFFKIYLFNLDIFLKNKILLEKFRNLLKNHLLIK